MKRSTITLFGVMVCCITFLGSCQAIGSIFGAGFKVGIWVAAIVVIGIVVLLVKGFGSKKT